jgi:hypothetical protein
MFIGQVRRIGLLAVEVVARDGLIANHSGAANDVRGIQA